MSPPPKRPEISFLVCEDKQICLNLANARQLTLWLLEMERWVAEVQTRCLENSDG